MSHCPKCNSEDVRRSRTRSWWERLRRDVTGKRPYRCRGCNWRGWLDSALFPEQPAGRGDLSAADAPNLKGTMLARSDPRLRVDLKKLDSFHSVSDSATVGEDDE